MTIPAHLPGLSHLDNFIIPRQTQPVYWDFPIYAILSLGDNFSPFSWTPSFGKPYCDAKISSVCQEYVKTHTSHDTDSNFGRPMGMGKRIETLDKVLLEANMIDLHHLDS